LISHSIKKCQPNLTANKALIEGQKILGPFHRTFSLCQLERLKGNKIYIFKDIGRVLQMA